jgi:23S rRNA (uracil1939-C5)-methyltransferase
VLAEPVAKRGEGWFGTADIVTASPDRVAPPCAHFGQCGGCALQHWAMPEYLAWKSGLLGAALRRAGYEDAAIEPVLGTPPGARRRIDLAIRRKAAVIAIGLHAARAADVVDMHECKVLHPTLFGLIAPLRDVLRGLSALRREGSAVLNLLDAGPDLLLRLDGELNANDRTRLAAFAGAHGLPRISWSRGDKVSETACLLRQPVVRFAGVAVTPPPGAFLQASREGEAAIIAAVLAGLPAKLTARARVAELYAGCGTLSFALAERVRVAAYEGDAAAAAALTAAVNAAKLPGRIEVQRRDLARQPLSAKELSAFAAVVLDPPHAGAAAQIGLIAASGVARVVYVSCNPAALARDAKLLHQAGYKLISCAPVDQFLWSARLESVVVFGR